VYVQRAVVGNLLAVGKETAGSAEENLARQNLGYTVNYCVAVKGERCTKEMPFWLGQILETCEDPEGRITHLQCAMVRILQ